MTSGLTSSAHLDDIADGDSTATVAVGAAPRHGQFTMMSRPLRDHPECVEREGYVRGQFESVEFIREIPADCGRGNDRPRRTASTPNVPGLDEERPAGRQTSKTFSRSASDDERSTSPRGIYH